MPSHTRRRRKLFRNLDRKWLAIGGGAAVVIGGAIAAIALTGASGPKHPAASHPGTTEAKLASNRCPLTDLPAPGGKVPQREPVAVKIGNEPPPGNARPQSGLNEADIVYDTPAEGGIMRYIAVFQCNSASSVGPVRSVRWVDWHILEVFQHSALAFVGGIDPNQATVKSLPFIDDANEFLHYNIYTQDPNRVAPDSTYTSTSAVLSLFPSRPAPRPIFTYTPSLPKGALPATSLGLNFSAGTDVLWKWNPSGADWVHTYSGQVDTDALSGQPVTTTNIIVQIVHYTLGPYPESPGGSGDVESQTVGSGPGYIFRNGEEIPVTWHRSSLTSVTTFTDAKGQTVGLEPGRTWVEIVLDTVANEPGGITITH